MSFKVTNVYHHSDSAYGVREFICDSVGDLSNLPRFGIPGKQEGDQTSNEACAYGSTAIVCDGSVTETYILTPNNEWTKKIESQSSGAPGVTSWNDLEDKPFYDEGVAPITWDGNRGDREAAVLAAGSYEFVRVSDTPISLEDLIGAKVTRYSVSTGTSTTQILTEESLETSSMPDYIGHNDGAVHIITRDDITVAGLYWPKKGVYFQAVYGDLYTTELVCERYSIKTLDEKYIPDTIQRTDEAVTSWNNLPDRPFGSFTELTWDGNLEGMKIAETSYNKWAKISDKIFTTDELLGGGIVIKSPFGELNVEINEDTIKTEGGVIMVKNPNGNRSEPLCVVIASEGNRHSLGTTYIWCDMEEGKGLYFLSIDNLTEFTMSINHEVIKTLDEKYLPDTIPNTDKVQQMINDALGVIENGTY